MLQGQINRTLIRAGIAVGATLIIVAGLSAHSAARMELDRDERCIFSDGMPDHPIGQFPNAGNPNSLSAQDIAFCVDATPEKNALPRRAQTVGVTLDGITIRPGTADWYDADARRGHSRDRSSGWNLEGMGSAELLGIDQANGHVDNTGLYHYHGPSALVMAGMEGTLLGYAADGFEIHYVGSSVTSSWQLKQGTRPTAPGGVYDGSYVEDYQYVAGSGMLDECNGGYLNGAFVYFATDTYPFFPRCLWGDFEAQVRGNGAPGVGQPRGSRPGSQRPGPRPRG